MPVCIPVAWIAINDDTDLFKSSHKIGCQTIQINRPAVVPIQNVSAVLLTVLDDISVGIIGILRDDNIVITFGDLYNDRRHLVRYKTIPAFFNMDILTDMSIGCGDGIRVVDTVAAGDGIAVGVHDRQAITVGRIYRGFLQVVAVDVEICQCAVRVPFAVFCL